MEKNKQKIRLSKSFPLIENFSTRKEWKRAAWKSVVYAIYTQSSLKELAQFLKTILTSSERDYSVMRTATLAYLQKGMSYRKISQELWLSSQTISSIRKSYFEKNYQGYWARGKRTRREQIKNYKKFLKEDAARSKEPTGRLRRTKYGKMRTPF